MSHIRKFLKRLVAGLTTFVVGLSLTYFLQTYHRDLEIYRAVEIPEFCELHGEMLRRVQLELTCGEFKNSRSDYLKIPCGDGANPQLAAEEALLYFHLDGGLSTLEIWHTLETARQSNFPHGYGEFLRECSSDRSTCKTRNVCAKCRAAELTWMKQHSEYLSK